MTENAISPFRSPPQQAARRTLVLIRHPESTKNVVPHFSAASGAEQLTEMGRSQTRGLAAYLSDLLAQRSVVSVDVFCSETDRSTVTASSLVARSRVLPMAGLAPIRAPYPGMKEKLVAETDPEFYRLLMQYRLGLRSAYDIPRGQGELVLEFERRIATCLKVILLGPADLSIVVGHRSTITAILLYAARQLANYPAEWYGHVLVPLASVSVLEHDGDRFTAIADACRVVAEEDTAA